MRFSVIVPVYKVERYLAGCLDSILAQSFEDYEIIAVNDGSPDGSQTILEDYQSRYPQRICVLQKKNGGLSDARNYGIERARGDYLVFVDSDDSVVPQMLSLLEEQIQSHKPDVIGFRADCVDGEGKTYDVMTKPVFSALKGDAAIRELVLHRACFEPAWGFVYKRDYWNKQGFAFTKGIYHEDYALIPLVVLLADSVSCIEASLYRYVSNPEGITKKLSPQREKQLATDLLSGYDGMVSACQSIPPMDEEGMKLFWHYMASSLIYRLESLSDPNFRASYRRELKQRRVIRRVMNNTWKRKIRRCLIRLKNKL